MSDLWEHLLPAPSSDKAWRFHRVGWAVAVTLLRSGPESLRVSDIARRAGVSRAWVYKYLGGDHEALLAFAVDLFGKAFASPSSDNIPADAATWRAGVWEGTRKGLDDVLVAPWCILVYVRYRHAMGHLGEQLRALEASEIEGFVAPMPPSVRRAPGTAAFAAVFSGARLGLYHLWLDPTVRASLDPDAAVQSLLGLVDAHIARATS